MQAPRVAFAGTFQRDAAGFEKGALFRSIRINSRNKNRFQYVSNITKKNDEDISHHLVEIDCTTVHSIKRNEPLKNPLYGFVG